MSFRIAHLSDLHLGPMPFVRPWQLFNKRVLGFQSWQFNRRRVHKNSVVEAMIRKIEELRPDHIALTGDLVNIALPHEFERSLAWIERFEAIAPVSIVPGNHDAYVPGFEPGWGLWRRWMGGQGDDGKEGGSDNGDGADGASLIPPITPQRALFPYSIRQGPLRLIGLSSAVPTPWGRAWGLLGDEQLAALDELLARNDAKWTIILVHHPAFEGASKWRKALRDAPSLKAVLDRHHVDLVLSGHEHKHQMASIASSQGDALAITVPSASIDHEDPARTGGFNLLTLEKAQTSDGAKLAGFEQWRYDSERKMPIGRLEGELRFDGRHWDLSGIRSEHRPT